MASPSISTKARPRPESFCRMKPSPPKKPALNLRLKWMDSSTPVSAARKALFCRISSRPGSMRMGSILPGKLEPKVTMPGPFSAVKMFWNMLSPDSALENILPRPPPRVSIFMLGLCQTMDPFSVIICSPASRWQTTTGKAPP